MIQEAEEHLVYLEQQETLDNKADQVTEVNQDQMEHQENKAGQDFQDPKENVASKENLVCQVKQGQMESQD